jgi:hypothetical protein
MVGAWRMMVMHARDPARGMITPARGMIALHVFARRVVRSLRTANVATRHPDGVRSAVAAERTAAMTSATATTATMTSAAPATTTTGVATAAGGC